MSQVNVFFDEVDYSITQYSSQENSHSKKSSGQLVERFFDELSNIYSGFNYKIAKFSEARQSDEQVEKHPNSIAIVNFDGKEMLNFLENGNFACGISLNSIEKWGEQKVSPMRGKGYGFYGIRSYFDPERYDSSDYQAFSSENYGLFGHGDGSNLFLVVDLANYLSQKVNQS
jgi:hypothetical protein